VPPSPVPLVLLVAVGLVTFKVVSVLAYVGKYEYYVIKVYWGVEVLRL
jgi:hypothetical protein